MRAQTKLRLLAVPSFLGTLVLLLVTLRFGPKDIPFHYFVLDALILLFTCQIIWWAKRGRALSADLVQQMRDQRAIRSQFSMRFVEDRLDELERLKRRAMVSPEEYEAKRKDILRDL